MFSAEPVKHAVVTGAASGLGLAFCQQLLREGWHVAMTDVDPSAAQHLLGDAERARGAVEFHSLDVTDISAWQQLEIQLRERWPRIDLLINNAGVCSSGEIGDLPLEEFRRVVEVNLFGTVQGCHTFLPWLQESGGQVINVASIFGLLSPPATAAYNASKAAAISFSETLYAEQRPHGVGVTVAVPGFFASHLVERGQHVDATHRRIAEQFVRKSRLTAEAVAERALAAARSGRLYAVMGRKSRWYWRLKRLAPRSLAKLAARRFRRKTKKYQALE